MGQWEAIERFLADDCHMHLKFFTCLADFNEMFVTTSLNWVFPIQNKVEKSFSVSKEQLSRPAMPMDIVYILHPNFK